MRSSLIRVALVVYLLASTAFAMAAGPAKYLDDLVLKDVGLAKGKGPLKCMTRFTYV